MKRRGWYFVVVPIVAGIAVGVVALVLINQFTPQPGAGGGYISLESVERRVSDGFGEPARWETQALPHDWLLSGGDRQVEEYRHTLALNVPPDRLWAVLIRNVNLNAAIYLNGRLLGDGGRMREPITHNLYRPLMFSIPSGIMRAGENELLIRVASYPAGHGLLGKVQLGPHAELLALYERDFLVRVELARLITAFSGMMALVLLGIFSVRRHDTQYVWFGLAMAFWAYHSLKFSVSDVPISSMFWAWTLYASSISLSYTLFLFFRRFADLPTGRLDRWVVWLWLLSVLVITTPMLLRSDAFYPLAAMTYAASFVAVIYGLFSSALNPRASGAGEYRVLSFTVAFLATFAFNDVVIITGLVSRESMQLSVYAAPLLLAAFSAIMLRRFVLALSERELIARELEQRAEAAAARIVELETEQALMDQRQTIMRDMHDGVGGQLISSLALLDKKEAPDELLRGVLQGALTDLRLMIDSLDTEAEDLNLLLGALRERLEALLRSTGHRVEWRFGHLPAVPDMTPNRALNIVRILQEAIVNATRHAKADHVLVSSDFREASSEVVLCVSDNGTGIADDARAGRGLSNMRRRAELIDACLTITERSGGGTEVILSLGC